MTNNAQLTVQSGPQHHLQQIFLLSQQKERIIGRSSICHFRLDDPLLSSLHCLVYYQNSKFYIKDLLSANGIFIDNKLIYNQELEPQQQIKIGKTTLEYSLYTGEQEGKEYLTGDEPSFLAPININQEEEKNEKNTTEPPLGRKIKNAKDLNTLRLAIRYNLIQLEKIQDLLNQSKKQQKTICQILTEENHLSEDKINTLLNEHKYNKIAHKDTILGKLAIRYNMITEEKLQECLQEQQQKYHQNKKIPRLSELMVEKQYITIQQNNKLIKILTQERLS